MKVEIWSDVICPWCGLGQHRLDKALDAFEHKDGVEVVHRSFQLDPRFPAGTTETTTEMLGKKYGWSENQLRQSWARIQALAAADGLTPYHLDNLVGNTGLAHQLLAYASEQGLEEAAWKRFYKAYFGEKRSIFDVDALVALGVEVGLPEAGIREALTSGRYAAQVAADQREASMLGARGVPFVVIDRKYGVAGAQSIETFQQALDRAWAERSAQETPR